MNLGRVGIVVAARTGSRRLPGKALLPLKGVPMIVFLLRRVRTTRRATLVFATTERTDDDPLAAVVAAEGIPVFRGADADVVARYVAAAERFAFDTVVRVTGDCPFVNGELVDHCLAYAGGLEAFDLVTTKTRFPVGLDVEIYRAASMAALHVRGDLTAAEREHLTLRYYNGGDAYKLRHVDPQPEWPLADGQFTVDTAADYARATVIADALGDGDISLASMVRVARGQAARPANAMGSCRDHLEKALDDCTPILSALPIVGIGAYARVTAALDVLIALDRTYRNPNDEPYGPLIDVLRRVKATAESATALAGHLTPFEPESGATQEHVAQLFAKAWTTYSDSTYDHSVGLVVERLKRSGFDEAYFHGKTCFDGGCGTGRLSIAMAKAGARKVVAADLSEPSLDYLERTMARYGLRNIEVVRQDVTDLSRFETASFDFVASNGVLHHTPAPERGIVEHFRITKPGGIFWLYLYGAGGLYWDVYDRFRPVVTALSLEENHRILRELRMREGLIYTFLDNLRAPRVYYLLDDVLAMLRRHGKFDYRHARGMSVIDDTEMLLATKWGPAILGPQGEIRIAVTKQ